MRRLTYGMLTFLCAWSGLSCTAPFARSSGAGESASIDTEDDVEESSTAPVRLNMVEHPNAATLTVPAAGAIISTTSIRLAYSMPVGVKAFYIGVGTTEESVSKSPWGNILAKEVGPSVTAYEVAGINPNGNRVYVRLWTKLDTWYSRLYSFETSANDNSIAQQIEALGKKNDELLAQLLASKTAIQSQITQTSSQLQTTIQNNHAIVVQMLTNLATVAARIEASIATLQAHVTTKTNALMQKLTAIEGDVDNQAAALAAIQGDVDGLRAEVQLMDQSVLFIEDKVTVLHDLLNLVVDRTEAMEDQIDQQAAALLAQILAVKSSVATVKAAVDTAVARVDIRADELRDDIWFVESETQRVLDELYAIRSLIEASGEPWDGQISQLSGYLEVFYSGEWRGVCDDNFDVNDARVVCRQMGLSTLSPSFATSLSGGTAYWLDDMACTGSESYLYQCSSANWGVHNCGAHEHVRVTCN